MATISRQAVENAAYDAGLDPDDGIRTDYSGRGMYGDECFAIVVDGIGEAMAFAAALERENHDGVSMDWLANARQDSMGRGIVLYWPGTTLTDD